MIAPSALKIISLHSHYKLIFVRTLPITERTFPHYDLWNSADESGILLRLSYSAIQLLLQKLWNSKRKNKNYELNKLNDIRRRNGNTILKNLRDLDKKANKFRHNLPLKEITSPDSYFQTVVEKSKQVESGRAGGRMIPLRRKKQKKQFSPNLFTLSKTRINKLKKDLSHQTKKDLIFEKRHLASMLNTLSTSSLDS